MKLLLSSAILAQIISSSTTPVAGEEKRFLLNKQRRAARSRGRLGKQLFSSFVSNRNPGETPPEAKPLRNAHQDFFDRVSFPHVRSPSNENNNVAEADVGLLAYQSPGGDVGLESEDPGTSRRLQSFCDSVASWDGFECDCSQVDETTYMGTASCTYKSEETCYCRDMDLEKQICYSYTRNYALEGNISQGGRYTTLGVELCITIKRTYLEESPPPLLCINYNYDEYETLAEECTMMLGDSICNSCTTSTHDGTVYTTLCGFNFDCENLGSVVTGTKVGSNCQDTNEWPLVSVEVSQQNEWHNVSNMCPAAEDSGPDDSTLAGDDGTDDSTPAGDDGTDDSTPSGDDGTDDSTPAGDDGTDDSTPAGEDDGTDDSTPTGDDAPAPQEGDKTPGGTDGAALQASSSSLSAMGGGAIMLIAWLFAVGM